MLVIKKGDDKEEVYFVEAQPARLGHKCQSQKLGSQLTVPEFNAQRANFSGKLEVDLILLKD